MIPLIVIQGPTAAGKSKLALDLATRLGTEIISADSRQIYLDTNIGTAKPLMREREQVKHHLVDFLNPKLAYSAGEFEVAAQRAAEDIFSKGMIPLLAGGTGFYVKALLEGIFSLPQIAPDLRASLREKGEREIFALLAKHDFASYERINKNDKQRALRALEVYLSTGISMEEHWRRQKAKKAFKVFNIFVYSEREELYAKINRRVKQMEEQGLSEEVERLLEMGYSFDDPGLNSVGYKEFAPFFRGEQKLELVLENIAQNTRNYAKRQFTWYKKVEFTLAIEAKKIIISSIEEKIHRFFAAKN